MNIGRRRLADAKKRKRGSHRAFFSLRNILRPLGQQNTSERDDPIQKALSEAGLLHKAINEALRQ
jgi:hypothetical protein